MIQKDMKINLHYSEGQGDVLPPPSPVALAAVRSKAVVLLLLICCLLLLPLWDFVIVLCFVVRYFASSAIISMGKRARKLVDLLCLTVWCLMIAVWIFLTTP